MGFLKSYLAAYNFDLNEATPPLVTQLADNQLHLKTKTKQNKGNNELSGKKKGEEEKERKIKSLDEGKAESMHVYANTCKKSESGNKNKNDN